MKNIKKAQAGARMKAAKAAAVRKIDSAKAADKAKKLRYDLEKNPGESGKNFGKSDAGYLKPTMGGAKGGKKIKYKSGGAVNYKGAAGAVGLKGSGTYKPGPGSTGHKIGKCRGGC